MSNKFSKDYTINIYDVDSSYKCKYSSIMNYLWDVIVSQSDSLGETDHGFVNNCIWVLLKYDLDIIEYPKFRETIKVETDIVGVKKLYGYRSLAIRNSEDKVIISGISTAILIDFEERRPVKMSPEQYKIYGIEKELEKNIPLDDFINLEESKYSKDYMIRYSDIDSNKHVNNVKYIEMAVDTLPRNILNEYEISKIKVLFKHESMDESLLHIHSDVIKNNDGTLTTVHSILDDNHNKPITKLEFKWIKYLE
ncbi:thioesterase [Clostridium sp. AL.422]|uniref:acyl-[acyl-carrier-protein] thioesterase n=1 Tax=Clostridium TaxID=1485 RepID=UPI00293DB261|nr:MULTISPECIES: acyl-ACP thioesterase domain-containing protein [unclassified Clostridium]MDV4149595.1 thioesterase [Clostridium sp. AL.422]